MVEIDHFKSGVVFLFPRDEKPDGIRVTVPVSYVLRPATFLFQVSDVGDTDEAGFFIDTDVWVKDFDYWFAWKWHGVKLRLVSL